MKKLIIISVLVIIILGFLTYYILGPIKHGRQLNNYCDDNCLYRTDLNGGPKVEEGKYWHLLTMSGLRGSFASQEECFIFCKELFKNKDFNKKTDIEVKFD